MPRFRKPYTNPYFWEDVRFVLGILAAIVLVIGGVFGFAKYATEKGCNQEVERLNNPRIVDGDNDFWASQCYVEMDDGRVIPLRRHLTFEREDGVIR